MQELMIDLKNYKEDGSIFRRTAVRGIVEKDGKYLIIHSKYGDYKFPGGGMEGNETHEETLIREMQEETGYHVLPKSMREGIKVKERRKGEPDDIMEMESYYYFCAIDETAGERNLDAYEKEYDYQVDWLPLEEIIRRNELVENYENIPWIVRETMVMKEMILRKAEKQMMELWDIYDKNKKRTGSTMERNDFRLKDGEYHLTVLGVVRRSDGKFLITKRVMTKRWAAGWWEVSGGAAQAGEDSEEAVLREVKEETGLDVSNFQKEFLFTYKRENPEEGDNYFVDVYRFTGEIAEQDIHMQEEETDGYMFATAEEIEEIAKEGKFLHYDSIKAAFWE